MNTANLTTDEDPILPCGTCFLGLGANLGDRVAALQEAIATLDARTRIAVDFASGVASLYETPPVGCVDEQPNYLNSAIRIETTLSPDDLLAVTLDIEAKLGRRRLTQREARIIDIDLLLCHAPPLQGGDGGGGFVVPASYPWIVAQTDTLTLPHPRLCERRFVLEPLAEIARDVVHPTANLTIAELAKRSARVHPDQTIARIAGPEWVNSTITLHPVSNPAT